MVPQSRYDEAAWQNRDDVDFPGLRKQMDQDRAEKGRVKKEPGIDDGMKDVATKPETTKKRTSTTRRSRAQAEMEVVIKVEEDEGLDQEQPSKRKRAAAVKSQRRSKVVLELNGSETEQDDDHCGKVKRKKLKIAEKKQDYSYVETFTEQIRLGAEKLSMESLNYGTYEKVLPKEMAPRISASQFYGLPPARTTHMAMSQHKASLAPPVPASRSYSLQPPPMTYVVTSQHSASYAPTRRRAPPVVLGTEIHLPSSPFDYQQPRSSASQISSPQSYRLQPPHSTLMAISQHTASHAPLRRAAPVVLGTEIHLPPCPFLEPAKHQQPKPRQKAPSPGPHNFRYYSKELWEQEQKEEIARNAAVLAQQAAERGNTASADPRTLHTPNGHLILGLFNTKPLSPASQGPNKRRKYQ
jgi:hypothetical protein